MVTAPDPRRAQSKGQRTRERLLRAAIDRFGAEGFRGTAVSQLSRDAGLTPAAAYAYFTDKEAFWAAAIGADLDDLDEEIRAEALRSDRPLFVLMLGLVEGLQRHPLVRRVLEEGTPEDLELVLHHRLFVGSRNVTADVLRARVKDGRLSPDADPDDLALGVESVMFSMVLSWVRGVFDENSERLTSVVSLLRAAVGGVPERREVEAFGGSRLPA